MGGLLSYREGEENGLKFQKWFSVLLLSSAEIQIHGEIICAASLCVYTDKIRQESNLFFPADTLTSHTDALKIQMHTPHTLLRGPGLHFIAVCPTSSRSASFHLQQRHGK